MIEFKPHLFVLGLIGESPISMGRQLLCSCLIGEHDDRIVKLRLDRLVNFGSLPLYDKKDILELTDILLHKGLIEFVPLKENKFIKVLALTQPGKRELASPELEISLRKSYEGHYSKTEKVTEEDIKTFSKLGNVLDGLSDEQKKAVLFEHDKILCIAGAGSGKTKVLTKRAWFLSYMKSVEQKKILAITFTRKARHEMLERLNKMLPNHMIQVETFNSFCEQLLRKNEGKIYDRKYKVMDYSTKVKMIMTILEELGMNTSAVLDLYYTDRQLNSSDRKTLFLGFINDIFSLLDYQRNNAIDDDKLFSDLQDYQYIKDILLKVNEHKEELGLRDFTDQMLHVIDFFRKYNSNIPKYEHILVDEYQDINSLQYELINLLKPKNLFCVGDPRQSIYGWRGSRIDYVLDFETNYPGSKILELSTNYRSSKEIVELCNKVSSPMKLPPIKACNGNKGKVSLVKQDSEDLENLFVCQSILSMDISRNNIFVLARTNKQIEHISEEMSRHGIKFIKRTIEDLKLNRVPEENEVTLSTVHAIKGLEAELVYVIGANSKNHPCKASEHPVLEAVKMNDTYDKFSEELRLMYVALSRAKEKLIVSYSGSLSSYFEEPSKANETKQLYKSNKRNGSSLLYEELKGFRFDESKRLGILPYQVFNDKTLDELCDVKPTNMEELSDITGFGPYKLRKWGNKIIKLIMQHS